MRILVVGSGGVGASIASIAEERDFFDHFVIADITQERAQKAIDDLDDPSRFHAAKVDARDQRALVDVMQSEKIDVIVNACDPRLNPPIFDAAFDVGCTYIDMAMNLSEPHHEHPFESVGVPLGAAHRIVAGHHIPAEANHFGNGTSAASAMV